MNKYHLLLIIGLFPLLAQAQTYGKKRKSAFPDPLQYKLSGWYFTPGATYTLTRFDTETETVENLTEVNIDPAGALGAYAAFGRYHILEYAYLFKYLDYGIAYKWLRGSEAISMGGTNLGENAYSDHYASLHFNLNNVIEIADYSFIQNTIGINGDYLFAGSKSPGVPDLGLSPEFPGSFVAQLHYKLGYGIKASKNLIIIPALETPILNILPFEYGRSSLGYFNSRYRPLILSVRFLFLRKIRLKSCKPVKNPDVPGGIVIPDDMEH